MEVQVWQIFDHLIQFSHFFNAGFVSNRDTFILFQIKFLYNC